MPVITSPSWSMRMAESPGVRIRLPEPLNAACEKAAAAAGLSVPLWLRSLAERETGVKADPKPGASGLSKRKRKQISRAGVAARLAKARQE